jgi:hypothetical protein
MAFLAFLCKVTNGVGYLEKSSSRFSWYYSDKVSKRYSLFLETLSPIGFYYGTINLSDGVHESSLKYTDSGHQIMENLRDIPL